MTAVLKVSDILKVADQRMAYNIKRFSWHGKQVAYKYTLTREEQMDLEKTIVDCCVDKDKGIVILNLYDLSFKINILAYYVSMTIPEDIEEIHSIVYCTDLYDAVIELINKTQVLSIKTSTSLILGLGGVDNGSC